MINLNQEDEKKSVDIPDFVEDKTTTESSSVDLSIFKMSDEELYVDAPEDDESMNENNLNQKHNKKSSNSTLILCLILIGILLVTTIVSFVLFMKANNKVSEYERISKEAQTQVAELNTKVSTLNSQISELEKKLAEKNNSGGNTGNTDTKPDPNAKYAAGLTMYITKDGGSQGVRKSPSVDSEDIKDSDGNDIIAYWGDIVTLAENATVDSNGNYWAKINKLVIKDTNATYNNISGYIRIQWNGETWATVEEQ